MNDPKVNREQKLVIKQLDTILAENDFKSLGTLSMEDLRALRDSLAEIESALSFGRRMAQGRLDILFAESERRVDGGEHSTRELVQDLPEVLSRGSRGSGNPRPVRDIEMPELAEEILDSLNSMISTTEMGSLNETEAVRLSAITDQVAAFERSISERRHEVHRIIDSIQAEIIARYRSGAVSVDDLLA